MSSACGSIRAVRLRGARTARPRLRRSLGARVTSNSHGRHRNRPDRVAERRRAVQLARHYREAEGLSITQIARRLGRSPATVKAYFYDPTGEKAKAVKARYQGVCRGCGAPTQPRNGKGDAYAYCKACHPGAIAPRWTRESVRAAMRAWHDRYGTAAVLVRLVAYARAAGAAPRRWPALPMATGPPRAPSPTSTEHGPPPRADAFAS